MVDKVDKSKYAKGWFCTWPQCPIPKELALKLLDGVLGGIKEYVIAEEKHEDGSPFYIHFSAPITNPIQLLHWQLSFKFIKEKIVLVIVAYPIIVYWDLEKLILSPSHHLISEHCRFSCV